MPTAEELNKLFPLRWEFERSDDGILVVYWKQQDQTVKDEHGFFDPFIEGEAPHLPVADKMWTEIGGDYDNKIVILTGYEGVFSDERGHAWSMPQGFWTATMWQDMVYRLPKSLMSFLDLPTLLIGAANGPAYVHAEYLMLCDIVVAAESASFRDHPHFERNTVPGDGVNIVWPLLLGWNRGRHFLLSGRTISAHEALDLGLVSEVVPDEELLPRCQEIARDLLKQDEMTVRYTAPALRQQLKMMVMQYMQHSLGLEGIVFMEQSHHGPR